MAVFDALLETEKWSASWVVIVMALSVITLIWAADKGVDQRNILGSNDRIKK